MDQPNTKLALIGSGIGITGLVTCVISTALDYWYLLSVSAGGVTEKVYFGLWELCVSPEPQPSCVSWSEFESQVVTAGGNADIGWLHACQAFMVAACICLGIGVVLSSMFALRFKSSKAMMLVGGGLCVLSGTLALGAVILFSVKYNDSGLQDGYTGGGLHAGFGLAVVTVVLAKVGGFITLRNRTAFYSSFP